MNRVSPTRAADFTVLVCRLAIVATGIAWLFADDRLRFSVACAALLLTTVASALSKTTPLRYAAATVIAVLLAAHIVLGMQFRLYELSSVYDKTMHVVGSGAVSALLIIAARSFCDRERIKLPASLFALLVFSGALSAGTLWEIFEFAIDRTGLFVAQRGLRDTMIDLLADAVGALLALAVYTAVTHSKAT